MLFFIRGPRGGSLDLEFPENIRVGTYTGSMPAAYRAGGS